MNGFSACESVFHAKQAMYSPIAELNPKFEEDRLFVLTLQRKGVMHRCMTIAKSLREADARAMQHYGPLYVLDGWATRRLPIESRLIGGGYFIRSSRDANHEHSLRMISSIR